MAYSYISYIGNGVTTQYAVPFAYIRREHVTAQVNGSPATFTWVNDSTIQLTTAPADGAEVRLRRITPVDLPLADYTDGSSLTAADLDINNLQHLYTEQELSDAVGPLSDIRGVYYGANAVDPLADPYGLPPDAGDQYFNSTTSTMRVYNGASWQDALPNVSIVRWKRTAIGGETTLVGLDDNNVTLTYTQEFEQVYLNGVLLTRGVDYTATNGNSITGLAALTAGDVVEVLAYSAAAVGIPTLALANGTAAAPSIAFESDPNTGLFRPGADEIAIVTGGTVALSLDAAGNATVGGDMTCASITADDGAFAGAVSGASGSFVGPVTGSSGAFSGAVSGASGVFNGDVSDGLGNVRDIPQNAQSSAYTLVAGDAGKHISITTGGVTVPAGVFSVGDAITIFNNSSSNQTITQGAGSTMRQAGSANTGSRTLEQYGLCTVLCVASNVFVITGVGLI